jgi:hypothetical protein
MSGRKYYCFCDSNCKFETMTKEQIIAAIAQAAENGLVIDEDAAFITQVKEMNAGSALTFWRGTQAQYNALERVDGNCFYIITDKHKHSSEGFEFAEAAEHPGCFYRVTNSGEMEWLNPPMVDGGTYRTTERFNGTPVYMDFAAGSVAYTPALETSTTFDVGEAYALLDYGVICARSDGWALPSEKIEGLTVGLSVGTDSKGKFVKVTTETNRNNNLTDAFYWIKYAKA